MKFRQKIAICMVWIFALVFGLGGGLMISLSFQSNLEQEEKNSLQSYQMTMSTLKIVCLVSLQTNFSDVANTLAQMQQQQAGWAAVRLSQLDEVLYESGQMPAVDNAPQSTIDTCVCTPVRGENGRRYLLISGQMANSDQPLTMELLYDVSQTYAARDRQLQIYRNLFLILIVSVALLSWTLAYFLTKPLTRLSKVTRQLAGGKLSVRVRVHSRDEVGQLAKDFNFMANKLEENMHELTDAMERQEQFMGSFAHELKTPMTSIVGYADLLRSDALTQEEAMDAANYIFSEGKRLETLSLKLLDLLMMDNQTLQMTTVEPAQLIEGLVRHLQPVYAQKGIRLQCKCKPGVCQLEADLVKSLLTNLLDNARKAMDESGGNIFVLSDWLDGACRIRVLDNGRGIPHDKLAHLTEAFYRVDKSRSRKQGGAGLGLTLCSRIVQLHDGELHFDSREDNGTCVTVILRGEDTAE